MKEKPLIEDIDNEEELIALDVEDIVELEETTAENDLPLDLEDKVDSIEEEEVANPSSQLGGLGKR